MTVAFCFLTDRTPILPELTDFPGKTRHFNIAAEIGMQYYMVGITLLNDERGAIVPAIVSEHRGNAEQINMDILSRWVQGKGIYDRTWRGLLGVLRVYCPGLAQDIEETLRGENSDSSICISIPGSIASPHQQQSALSHFNKKLRDWYGENPLPYYFDPRCYKWMPNVSKAYIHPEIISKEEQEEQPDSHKEAVLHRRITEKRSGDTDEYIYSGDTEEGSSDTVQLTKLLEASISGEKGKCVLVEGSPGIGKSTLAWQVCHRWGRRQLFDQYSTVLLLPLRNTEVQQAKQVEDLIKDEKDVIQEIGTGIDTLIIMDGLDELPSHLLSKQTIFTDLLSGNVFSDATILVTSRPSATQQLLTYWKKRISKHFIIQGFKERNIIEYTESILSGENLAVFQKHLSIHPHIQAIMYVPLHSALVMAVYLQHKQLPKTLTQLYMMLAEMFLSQYLDDHPEHCGEEEISCAIGLELPKLVYAQFTQLCKIAFDTVCRQELIFTNKTMPKALHDLGFTDSVPGLYMRRTYSYNFLHLSIQEFLAAYHVSLLSPQEQEQLLLRSREEHHLKNMMRFVAGITKFEGITKEAIKQVTVVVKKEWNEEKYCLDSYSLELLYECQNMSILGKEGTYSAYSSSFYPAHHWLALGYCIANSECAWKVSFSPHINTQVLLQGLQDCKTQPAYTIKSIDWEPYSEEVYCKLLHFTTHTENMILRHSIDVSYNMTNFCKWLPTCHLKTLSLPRLQPHNIEMVSRALTAVPSLKTLDMVGSKFILQSMQAFAYMLQRNQSLTRVDISCCKMCIDSACCLARALHNNKTLTALKMNSNSLCDDGALAVAEMLKHNTTLTVLDMSGNSIRERGALAMAEMLKRNISLTELDMCGNSVGNEGALAMAEMLEHNTTLTVLYMSGNSVGERGGVAMVEMLKHNTTLTRLYMSGNSVGEKGALALVDMLKHNTTLTVLSMSRNSLGEWGGLAMVEMLKHNSTLTKLYVSENSIGERGALVMAEMLKYNTTLTVLCMNENSVGEKGALAMAEMLKYNTTLTVLYMSENSVGEKGALAMAEMLKHNTTLEELGIRENAIGVEGAKALVESLAVNQHLKVLYISYKCKKDVEALPAYHANKERLSLYN